MTRQNDAAQMEQRQIGHPSQKLFHFSSEDNFPDEYETYIAQVNNTAPMHHQIFL
jgi:hypothetical protein